MIKQDIATLFDPFLEPALKKIASKVLAHQRIDEQEALLLFEKAEIGFLGTLANYIREHKHDLKAYFNRNIHIEPTNICVFDCKFCSYSRLLRQKGDDDAWELSEQEIYDKILSYPEDSITEVHIVGGVHPKMGLHYFANLIKNIKTLRPKLHVKAFTAVELEYMCRKAKLSYSDGLKILKENGQDSLPGGGAEIFDETIREKICHDKCTSEQWLSIHQAAHELGMPSNATILYGHIESYKHRIDHMNRLRMLQDKTNGFNTFIPLKFRNGGNQMSNIKETTIIEDLKMYAIARIFMDNFSHLKAYWPMLGRQNAQLLLNFGVDDLDGTIDDTTKIYPMAGSEEQKPSMSTNDLVNLIKAVGKIPVERDSVYNILKEYN
ncbi:MAG: radical SAM protein [Bacteroidota bacterium]